MICQIKILAFISRSLSSNKNCLHGLAQEWQPLMHLYTYPKDAKILNEKKIHRGRGKQILKKHFFIYPKQLFYLLYIFGKKLQERQKKLIWSTSCGPKKLHFITENRTQFMPTFRCVHPLLGVSPLLTHGTPECTC